MKEEIIANQINKTIKKTNFDLENSKEYFDIDLYEIEDKLMYVYTDRLYYKGEMIGTIPFKGQIINQISVFWFNNLKNIFENQFIESPDPNISFFKKCKKININFIVQGYLEGSLWEKYEKGDRYIHGLKFNKGLKEDQLLDMPVVTARKICSGEILKKEYVQKNKYLNEKSFKKLDKLAIEMFEKSCKILNRRGLELIKSEYQFGIKDNEFILTDKVNKLDSIILTKKKIKQAKRKNLSNVSLPRNFLFECNKGKNNNDKNDNFLDNQIKIKLAKEYIKVYEKITGRKFKPETRDINKRINETLGHI